MSKSIRTNVLKEAEELTNGDRNNTYGPPEQDFQRTADILNSLGYSGPGERDLLPHDVSVMMIAVKMSRLTWSPRKRDTWVDIAGYAACGFECAKKEENDG